MSKLDKLFKLPKVVAIFVPSTTDVVADGADKQKEWADKIGAQFSEWFGGVTTYDAMGGWMSDDHGLVQEGIKIVESRATAEALAKYTDDVVTLAEQLKADMSQEAVTLLHEGDMYLV